MENMRLNLQAVICLQYAQDSNYKLFLTPSFVLLIA